MRMTPNFTPADAGLPESTGGLLTMSKDHKDSKEERAEAVLLMAKRISASGDAAVISPAFLDTITDTLQNSRHICFTGLGGYSDSPL